MARRIHTPQLQIGDVPLTADQSHHARKVLRLENGETVELFDDAGNVAQAILRFAGASDAFVQVRAMTASAPRELSLTIASAIPKGERADWMIEKLSELGVSSFIPLAAARSVVLPEGRNKLDRWGRIATESAKQSHRAGTMKIGVLTPPHIAVQQLDGAGWLCATGSDAIPIFCMAENLPCSLTLFVGPEGGWTDEERAMFAKATITAVQLTSTVLRVETAAIAAAAMLLGARR